MAHFLDVAFKVLVTIAAVAMMLAVIVAGYGQSAGYWK